jgi:hypothetical protein
VDRPLQHDALNGASDSDGCTKPPRIGGGVAAMAEVANQLSEADNYLSRQ